MVDVSGSRIVAERVRAMPLVPEPFANVEARRRRIIFDGISSGFEGHLQPTGIFMPELNTRRYLKKFTTDKKTELTLRANQLRRHSDENSLERVSESTWEADIRHDVFGRIRDDWRLRIDKRPYEYLESDDGGKWGSIKKKIPDATMGLRTFLFPAAPSDRPSFAKVKEQNGQFQGKWDPNHALCQYRLNNQMRAPKCGLVVDGLWGEANIVFPFAVFESKKDWTSYQQAEDQIYHAARTYLAMLDDLARNPNHVETYQSPESRKYQLFLFTNYGPRWSIYVARNVHGNCRVDVFWEDSSSTSEGALNLLCIVDQIHEFAVTKHRQFVIKHLEAWHKRFETLYLTGNDFANGYRKYPDLHNFDIERSGWETVKQEKSEERTKRNLELKKQRLLTQTETQPKRQRRKIRQKHDRLENCLWLWASDSGKSKLRRMKKLKVATATLQARNLHKRIKHTAGRSYQSAICIVD